MSQAYGRMQYPPTPHHHSHPSHHHLPHPHQPSGPTYREGTHHPGYHQRNYHPHQNHYNSPPRQPSLSYNNSVSVYSVPKPSRPYNTYANRRGRGGGPGNNANRGNRGSAHANRGGGPPNRGGYHNDYNGYHHNGYNHTNHHYHANQGYTNHGHNNYRPLPPDFDLEWDHYEFTTDGPKTKGGVKQKNSYLQHSGGPLLPDTELEWDDYDLRPKEEEQDTPDTIDYILTEGFPLIGVVTKAPLSRGHIPIGAIQVCRFPKGGASFKTLASSDHLSRPLRLNKELLVLTSDLDSPRYDGKDFLLADLALTRDKDSESSVTDSPSKDGESESASYDISSEDFDEDLLNDTYESGYQDRLGDIDLYALAPHDLDSPDSTFSRSLADLTDISLYEELGIDPSLLRLGLERSKSLGDTSAQDGSKDKSLKGAKLKKRKRKGSEKVEDSSTGGDEGSEKKTKRLAPNFFVAIQVSNPVIHEALKDVQQTVVTGDEKLKDAMVPIATMHLTIMVMHLATDRDVERAKVALNECHRLLSPSFSKDKLSILFGGLGHFNNQVMFAKIKDQDSILESLYQIADTVEKCFSEYQLVSTGERGFKPHLTVMKLSRAPSLRKKGVRRIKSELYKAHSSQVFGTQVVDGLQLCSINKPKTPDGYYYKAAEVTFGEPTCRSDREIHTIAEGEEMSVDSETPQRPCSNSGLGSEKQTGLSDGACDSETTVNGSVECNVSLTPGGVSKSSDFKHSTPIHKVCDRPTNAVESLSAIAMSGDATLDTSCDTAIGTSCDTSRDTSRDTTLNTSCDTSRDTSCDTSRDTSCDTTLNTSHGMTREISRDTTLGTSCETVITNTSYTSTDTSCGATHGESSNVILDTCDTAKNGCVNTPPDKRGDTCRETHSGETQKPSKTTASDVRSNVTDSEYRGVNDNASCALTKRPSPKLVESEVVKPLKESECGPQNGGVKKTVYP